MKRIDGLEALGIWERCIGLSPAAAMLLWLSASYPEISAEQLPRLTIGERDTLLLDLQERLFGPQLEGVATCPHCGERLEFSMTVSDMRAGPARTDLTSLGSSSTQRMVLGDYQVEFRVPTIADTQNVTSLEQLLERCVIQVTHLGVSQKAGELPQPAVEAISQQMALADPQADVQLALTCPACRQAWSVAFDIASFLWDEINSWAQRTLVEIHQLASAYGWSEAEILSVSPTRRQIYLTMIGAS
jgi:hypothetical protein